MWSLNIYSDMLFTETEPRPKIINRINFLLTKSENGFHRPEHHTRVKANITNMQIKVRPHRAVIQLLLQNGLHLCQKKNFFAQDK